MVNSIFFSSNRTAIIGGVHHWLVFVSSLLVVAVLLLPYCPSSWALSSPTSIELPKKVAVIGTTGRLGREVIQQLSKQGIATKCLLRHDLSSLAAPPSTLDQAETSAQIAAYLQQLPGVEMVQGDLSDLSSLERLLLSDDTVTAVLGLWGPIPPKPFIKSLLFPTWFFPESHPTHAKQVNYQGLANLLSVMETSKSCKRLVRITGKGETPWSIFSILINALGGMAKGWNYEGEQLIRKSNIAYTIIRPGIMKDAIDDEKTVVLGLRDNGGDLPVTAVSYGQIAELVIQVLGRENCQRATLTAMNVDVSSGRGEQQQKQPSTASQTLYEVRPDTRIFPESLIAEHKRAARVGGLAIMGFTLLLANLVRVLVGKLFSF